MYTLLLPRFTIGLIVLLFPTSLIQNTKIFMRQPSYSPQLISQSQHPQPHVDPLPSSPNISSSLSSSSLGKILDASNKVTKKKSKGKKKKQDNKEFNQPTIVVSIGIVEETSNLHHKTIYPCKLCKGDHFLIHYPSIPKVCKVWS